MIGIVALIVVGPKDLPGMFREMGRFTARIKGMARDFQRAMEDAADDSGVGDMTKSLRNIANPKAMGLDALNKATGNIGDWSPDASEPSTTPRGPETAKMTEERKEKAQKIQEAMAKKAEDRLAKEAAAKEAAEAPAPAAEPADPAPKTESKT